MKPYRKILPAILLSALAVATCSAQYYETPAQRLLRERGSILDKESVDQRQQRLEWERYQRERQAEMNRRRNRQTIEERIPVQAMPAPGDLAMTTAEDLLPARASNRSGAGTDLVAGLLFIASVIWAIFAFCAPFILYFMLQHLRSMKITLDALLTEQRAQNARRVNEDFQPAP